MNKVVGKILQDDRDFLVQIVDWQGKLAVKKSPKPTTEPKRIERLTNEAYGLEFVAELAEKYPQLKLYVPKLYDAEPGYIISEYIDAEPLVKAETPEPEASERLAKLAHQLSELDRIKPYGETRFIGHFDYRDIKKNFDKWTKEPMADKLISQAQVNKVKQLVESWQPYLQPRFAHGDLSPQSHAFLLDDGRIAWVDLENFTPSAARYYDVVRSYVRLYSFQASTDTAKRFLGAFLKEAEPVKHQTEQLMAIMLQRTLGMQYDAWYDAQKGVDYRDRAKELFELVLQNKLELLHSISARPKRSKRAIKAVAFDCFGVLTTEAFDIFRAKYMADDQAKLRTANKAMDELNAGRDSYDHFRQVLADLSGITPDQVEDILGQNEPNKPLFGYIRSRLKPEYKIGLLSNAGDDWLGEMFGPENVKLFDTAVLSFQVGMIKPQPKIYELLAKRLGVEPDEVVYVDDREKHLKGAREVGMQTVLYKDFQQAKRDLETVLAA